MLLYTIGDSFTYGDELAEPAVSAWPVLLSQKLGYELMNQGQSGAGNDYIVRTIIADMPVVKPDLVIVAWSACHRQEFSDDWDTYSIWPGCSGLGVTHCNHDKYGLAKHRQELIKYITMYNNPEYQFCRWLQSVILVQSYLKILQIPYVFVEAFDYNIDEYHKFNQSAKNYISQIDKTFYVGDIDSGFNTSFMDWCFELPKGPGGHPMEAGHQVIAQNLYREIIKRSLKK